MKIAFIGLGTMGARMARNLLTAGNDLVVHDARESAAASLVEAGARWAPSILEAVTGAEVVFTSLPGPAELEQVALSPGGLLESMEAGSTYFDMSTNSPTLARSLNVSFAERGIEMLDAPVSGGPGGAQSGHLVIWVGGDEATFTRYEDVLKAIGHRPYYVGAIGSGCIVKLVHNVAGYIINSALAEAFTLGVKAGVEPERLYGAVRESDRGKQFDILARQFIPGHFDPPDFALKLAHKDVGLATALAREYKVPMRLAALTLEELTEALNRGWGDLDSRIALTLETERAGVDVYVPMEILKEYQQ